ncbi:MAG: SurA N-terminal domain-containing protein [Candidatus Omnitrophica bacterium]|nr:SurA N-terminal domain-containing protein [Candidatus Omnitrophota bacterium]
MRVLLMLFLVTTLFISAGCGKVRQGGGEDTEVVAKINNYELTVRDLMNEADFKMSEGYLKEDPFKAKRMLLESIIMAKILLQEAQKKSFDKDEIFMKEIELYWEQALLKLLLRKKTEEFSRRIVIKDEEIQAQFNRMVTEEGDQRPFSEAQTEIAREIYNKKMQENLNEWLKEIRSQADVKVNEKVLNKVIVAQ